MPRFVFKSIIIFAFCWVAAGCAGPQSTLVEDDTCTTLPDKVRLENVLALAMENGSPGWNDDRTLSTSEKIYEIKKTYYEILAKRAQLEIANEVRGHFEKAASKAQERYDIGEEDITQSAITKLKLGLSGTHNDISEYQAALQMAYLNLEGYLGCRLDPQVQLAEYGLPTLDYPYRTVGAYLKSRVSKESSEPETGLATFPPARQYVLRKTQIEINQARQKMELARSNLKMTRALLVTEVANYDFGIGEEGDLFEALIIYTRVLAGYNQALLNFDLKVSELEQLLAE